VLVAFNDERSWVGHASPIGDQEIVRSGHPAARPSQRTRLVSVVASVGSRR
jgi:hypothetical protein